MTKLIEFQAKTGETLRGLIDEADSKKAIIFVHGFERTTVEAKFKNFVDALKGKVNLFRFDFSGCGLSDGEFKDLTVDKMLGELKTAVEVFKNYCPQIENFSLVAHSLAGCVVMKFLSENNQTMQKVVFLSPAFNQKKLMRYWFASSQAKKEKASASWFDFQKFFSEEKFQDDLKIRKRMTKEHELLNDYFAQNEKIDFQKYFADIDFPIGNILIVHGRADDKVPLESNDDLPKGMKIIKVSGGDHDLQRPDMVKQYFKQVTDFLS